MFHVIRQQPSDLEFVYGDEVQTVEQAAVHSLRGGMLLDGVAENRSSELAEVKGSMPRSVAKDFR